MLSQLRSPRLCQGCRNDLLAIFDCAPGGPFRPGRFLLPSLISPSQTETPRRFSNSRLRRTEAKDSHPAFNPSRPGDAGLAGPTVTQNDAVPKSEQETSPTVEHHPSSHSLTRDELEGPAPGETDRCNVHKAGQDSVATESVVRAARQRFGESLPEGVLSKKEFKLYQRLYDLP